MRLQFIIPVGRLFSCRRDAETSSFFPLGAPQVIQIAVFSLLLLLLLCWGGGTNYFPTSSKQTFVSAPNFGRLSLEKNATKCCPSKDWHGNISAGYCPAEFFWIVGEPASVQIIVLSRTPVRLHWLEIITNANAMMSRTPTLYFSGIG